MTDTMNAAPEELTGLADQQAETQEAASTAAAESVPAGEAVEQPVQVTIPDTSARPDPKDTPSWYVAHTYSGYENKVKSNIEKAIENRHLEDQIFEVRIPVQEVEEVRERTKTQEDEYGNKYKTSYMEKHKVMRKMFPGYVLVNMLMNDETWYVVRNTRGVTGFVGPGSKPVPLTELEMVNLGIQASNMTEDGAHGLKVGDSVRIISGPFADEKMDVSYVIQAIDEAKQTIKIEKYLLGNVQLIDVNFTDIRKL